MVLVGDHMLLEEIGPLVRASSIIEIPEEFMKDSVYLYRVVDRGKGLVFKKRGRVRLYNYKEIKVGDIILLEKWNVQSLLMLGMLNGKGKYYIGRMGDVIGKIPANYKDAIVDKIE